MKKVVRMLGLCALVALAFTACKKNETNSVTFKASMPTINDASRTHVNGALGSYWLEWNDGDAIKVVDENGDSMPFTLTTNNGATAEFHVEGSEACDFLANLETAPYVAFYPNAVYTKGDTVVKMEIPAEQNIVGGFNFANQLYPMVGINTGTNFQFDSNAGFLYIPFSVREGTTVTIDRVVLTSKTEEALSGYMVYNLDGTFKEFNGTGNVITATWAEPQEVNQFATTDLTFVLPAGVLAGGFTVEVFNGDNPQPVVTYETINPVNVILAKTYREMPQMQLN